jgi:tRNA (guanine-N7-)-methyltransferase
MLSDRLFYGRRVGKGFSPAAAKSLRDQADDFCFSDPRDLLTEPYTDRFLEIGFGNGDHLLAQAAAHPSTLCVGVDAYQSGFTLALRQAHENTIHNVRLVNADVGSLLEDFPEAFFGKIFILFPDPWPKTRHHKRRLVSEHFLARLKRILKPSGFLVLATDHDHYAQQIREAVEKTISGSWLTPDLLMVTTSYQQKAHNAGRAITVMKRQFSRESDS